MDMEEEEGDAGSPAWMATFADLMSLLMCFFVLLLSFAEMDVIKFKAIAGSMREAFGVQSRIEAESIPKGTSVIKQEFSPGTPQPTPRPVINQQTTNDSQRNLQTSSSQSSDNSNSAADNIPQELISEKLRELLSNTSEKEIIERILKEGIAAGKIEVESSINAITIRISEKGSFPSGSARLNVDFLPLVEQLQAALKEVQGVISVEGHTDDVPIQSGLFESNWELSASRALSVAKELMRNGVIPSNRFMVVGYADTRPLQPNDTPANRAINRRVEIVIKNDLEDAAETELRTLTSVAP